MRNVVEIQVEIDTNSHDIKIHLKKGIKNSN